MTTKTNRDPSGDPEEQEMSDEKCHEVFACYSLRPEYGRHVPCLECSCGFRAYGECWEEAGLEFDVHTDENGATR